MVRLTQSAALAAAHRNTGGSKSGSRASGGDNSGAADNGGNDEVTATNDTSVIALDVDDVKFALEMDHGIQLPGFPNKRQRRT